MPLILILRPQKWFGIVGAELKRVASLGQFMMVNGTVRSDQADAQQEELHELAALCEELRTDSLYARYANRKMFRHEEDFWATKDKTVRQHVKRMADRRIIRAIGLADKLDIPILYIKDQKAPMHIRERLRLESNREVTPVMDFHRHDDGTTYRLQLRIDGCLVDDLSEHNPIVLTYEPGLFVLDRCIYTLGEGFSGQLLLPFVSKQQVEIPRKVENDYFHRFILKQVARAEINAEGFDIMDVSQPPRACLRAETSVDGRRLLSLRFRYGSLEYTPESKTNGRVTLTETDDGFCFVRQLRDKDEERRLVEVLKAATEREQSQARSNSAEHEQARPEVKAVTGEGYVICLSSLSQMVNWLREYAPRLKAQGFDVLQPSDHIYYIGPLSVEQILTLQDRKQSLIDSVMPFICK